MVEGEEGCTEEIEIETEDMTLEELDNTLSELLRLELVAQGYLPDITQYSDADAFARALT